MKQLMKPWVQTAIGIILILLLLGRLYAQGTLHEMRGAFISASAGWPWIIAAAAAILGCLIAGGWRWMVLLHAHNIPISFMDVMILMLAGHFFNLLMPGAVSGDLIKAWRVMRHAKTLRTEAFASVFLDRLIGLISLICMAAALMLINFERFNSDPYLRPVMWLCVISALALTAIAVLNANSRRRFINESSWLIKLFPALSGILPRLEVAVRWGAAKPDVTAKMVILSLANHIDMVLCGYFIARAMNLPITLSDSLVVFPVVSAAVMLPLTPGGLGTREAVTVYLLSRFGIAEAQAMALSLLFFATLAGWGVIGGITYTLLLRKQIGSLDRITTAGQ